MLDPWGVDTDDPSAWLENILTPDNSFKDEQLETWKRDQSKTLDAKERQKLVRQIELRLIDLLPVIPSVRGGQYTMGIWDKVQNYPLPVGIWNSHKYTEVWLAR